MSKLYVLDTHMAFERDLYAGGQWANDTRQRCPNCGAYESSTEPGVIEIALDQLGRNGFAEYLWNSHVLPIFRKDLIKLWQDSGLTGFDIKPVIAVGWSYEPDRDLPTDIPTYFRVVTTSKVRLTEPHPQTAACSICGFVKYAFPKIGTHLPNGIVIDQATYDGADLFGVLGYEYIFASHRAAEVTLRAKYNEHIAFVRMEDWERWSEFDVRKWTPLEHRQHVEKFIIRKPDSL